MGALLNSVALRKTKSMGAIGLKENVCLLGANFSLLEKPLLKCYSLKVANTSLEKDG